MSCMCAQAAAVDEAMGRSWVVNHTRGNPYTRTGIDKRDGLYHVEFKIHGPGEL